MVARSGVSEPAAGLVEIHDLRHVQPPVVPAAATEVRGELATERGEHTPDQCRRAHRDHATVLREQPGAAAGDGWARVRSEQWRVQSKVPLRQGQRVRVTARTGLVLVVEPIHGMDTGD